MKKFDLSEFNYKFWNIVAKPISLIIISLIIWYVIGLFLSFKFNPLEWWCFRTGFGRLVSLVIIIGIIKGAYDDNIF